MIGICPCSGRQHRHRDRRDEQQQAQDFEGELHNRSTRKMAHPNLEAGAITNL